MDAKLGSEKGKKVYGKRSPLVEGSIGIIKQAMGIRRFLQRGWVKVNCEWKMIVVAYNLKRMWAANKRRGVAGAISNG